MRCPGLRLVLVVARGSGAIGRLFALLHRAGRPIPGNVRGTIFCAGYDLLRSKREAALWRGKGKSLIGNIFCGTAKLRFVPQWHGVQGVAGSNPVIPIWLTHHLTSTSDVLRQTGFRGCAT